MTLGGDTEPSEWAHALGQTLLQLLVEHGHTQKWLARQVGLDPATISRIVKGLQPTTVDQVSKMARAFGVTRQSILSRAGYLEANGASTLDLDTLPPMAREMVLAAVRAALDTGE